MDTPNPKHTTSQVLIRASIANVNILALMWNMGIYMHVLFFCFVFFFPFILDIKFIGRTSRGHTRGRLHRISHPPSFCGACLYFCSREGFSHSFPSSTVKSNFVYLRFNRAPLVGHFYVLFLVRKNPVYRDSNSRPNLSEGYEVTSELPGRPA